MFSPAEDLHTTLKMVKDCLPEYTWTGRFDFLRFLEHGEEVVSPPYARKEGWKTEIRFTYESFPCYPWELPREQLLKTIKDLDDGQLTTLYSNVPEMKQLEKLLTAIYRGKDSNPRVKHHHLTRVTEVYERGSVVDICHFNYQSTPFTLFARLAYPEQGNWFCCPKDCVWYSSYTDADAYGQDLVYQMLNVRGKTDFYNWLRRNMDIWGKNCRWQDYNQDAEGYGYKPRARLNAKQFEQHWRDCADRLMRRRIN